MALPETKVYTVEEFEAFAAQPENRERLLELINGEIIEKVPTQEHGFIIFIIAGELYIYFKQHPIGLPGVEVRHRVPGDKHNAMIPDLSVIVDTDVPLVKEGVVLRMPDFAVEIKSPDDTYGELRAKAAYYLANGTRLVWLVYPDKKLVEVYRVGADSDLFGMDNVLDGDDVLPGFTLAVKDVFKK
jgi:Uma2 family endonuclease